MSPGDIRADNEKKIHSEFCLIELLLSIDLEYVLPINISFNRIKYLPVVFYNSKLNKLLLHEIKHICNRKVAVNKPIFTQVSAPSGL